jgi:dynein heavy chain, axonemal
LKKFEHLPAEHMQNVIDMTVLVHKSLGTYSENYKKETRRSNYVTPKHFLDLIKTYKKLIEDNKKLFQKS